MTRDDYLLFGARVTAKRGNDLPHAKLNPELVRYVRSTDKTAKQLAAELGTHIRTIEHVRVYRSWAHVR